MKIGIERREFIMPAYGCIDQMVKLVSIAPAELVVVTEFVD